MLRSDPVQFRYGVTLLELMIVILLMAVIAGLVLPSSQPQVHEQLRAAGNLVAGELELARSLAISYNTEYTVTVDAVNNRLILNHTGINAALNELPTEISTVGAADRTTRVLDFTKMSGMIGEVTLSGSAELGTIMRPSDAVEFGPAGTPINGLGFIIWIEAGKGVHTRYATVVVDGDTGRIWRGASDAIPPPTALRVTQ